MGKKGYIIAVFIGILMGNLFITWFYESSRLIKEKEYFRIQSSFSNSGPGYRVTKLMVIVYLTNYDTEKLFEEIKQAHNKLNGAPSRLTINLFNNQRGFENYDCIATKVYDYD